jgi:hypothetical protein
MKTDSEKKRSQFDEYRVPNMREVRFTTHEARNAIEELIDVARKQRNRAPELIAIVLQCIIQTEETIARDLELIRTRLDFIEKEPLSRTRR